MIAKRSLPSAVMPFTRCNISHQLNTDDSDGLVDVYEANVNWNGEIGHKLISEADTTRLMRMGLLRDQELRIEVHQRENVSIQELPFDRGRRSAG